jgi:LysM repeat protein
VRRLLGTTLITVLAFAAPASAEVAHTVAPGESLWSIAAANNLTTRTVAAYNGLSESSTVLVGQTIRVPTSAEGSAVLQQVAPAPAAPSTAAAGGYTVQPGDNLSAIAAARGTSVSALAAANGLDPAGLLVAGRTLSIPAAGAPATSATTGSGGSGPGPLGGYTVRPGDSLGQLAASSGVAPADIAAMNGLDPHGVLLVGTVLKLPTGAPAPARSAQPAPPPVVPAADPIPTATHVGASDVQSVASTYGVSPSLATAIAWQESGFNNGVVSSANARGVMQVMPGTWDYVERNLAGRTLNPASATDNVQAGVLFLRHLLQETGGDEATAAAAYYQGLQSVRDRGLYDDTQQYVANVQALRARFGG